MKFSQLFIKIIAKLPEELFREKQTNPFLYCHSQWGGQVK
jgi:hypothetical protein